MEYLSDTVGEHPTATYENALALAGILLETYRDLERAERAYRIAISLEPERYSAWFELAATMQAGGRIEDAIRLISEYQDEFGATDSSNQDLETLRKALEISSGAQGDG